MPFLFNENARAGVPIAYQFAYAGNSVDWGSTRIMGMSDVSCKAEPLDGKFAVSELVTTFSDTDGSLWGSLGHGTSCLGSSWSATVYIGGTMGEQTYGAGETRLARLNTQASGTYVIHKGRVTDVVRRNRTVEITSKSLMAQVADLEWRFPIMNESRPTYSSKIGSNVFFGTEKFQDGNILLGTVGTSSLRPIAFNLGEDNTKFELYAYVGPLSEDTVANSYPTPSNRGTLGLADGFVYPGTQFYLDYDRHHFQGSYLGTRVGTINDDETAQRYGYSNVDTAESARTSPTGLATYVIHRTRLTAKGDTPQFLKGSYFNWQQGNFTLEQSPAVLWREMLTGCCVTPLFGSSTDLDTDAYGTAASVTAFQSWSQRIDPKGGKVLPFLKNLMEPLSALFSINAQNQFRVHCYGPRTYVDVLGTITGTEIIESSVSSSMDDKFNRVVMNYGYDFETGSFAKTVEKTGSLWSHANDFPLELDTKWITNDNDAAITAERIVRRFYRGVPKLNIKVPLSRMNADIGSLYAITDTDVGYNIRVFEVVGWKKNLTEDRLVELETWDGDVLYKQKGFARYEGDNSLTAVVSGTSTSGYGTNGTVANINRDFYGSCFVYF